MQCGPHQDVNWTSSTIQFARLDFKHITCKQKHCSHTSKFSFHMQQLTFVKLERGNRNNSGFHFSNKIKGIPQHQSTMVKSSLGWPISPKDVKNDMVGIDSTMKLKLNLRNNALATHMQQSASHASPLTRTSNNYRIVKPLLIAIHHYTKYDIQCQRH